MVEPLRAAPPAIAHHARLHQHKVTRKTLRQNGNYDHDSFQYGVVHALHGWPNPSVDVYLDGTQNTNNTAYLTKNVPYDPSYAPTVGDVVLVYRGQRKNRPSRVVLCKLAGAASPYPVPLGGFDGSGRFTLGILNLWAAPGVPPANLGAANDWCASQNGHLYFNNAGTWTLKV